MSLKQELLNNTQNELCEQRNLNSGLKKLIEEKEYSLNQEVEVSYHHSTATVFFVFYSRMRHLMGSSLFYFLQIEDLVKKLKSVEAERNVLLSEKETNHQIHTAEMETLQSRVMSLSEKRDQLQELLDRLREKHLGAELEDKIQMVRLHNNKATDYLKKTTSTSFTANVQNIKSSDGDFIHLNADHSHSGESTAAN